MHSGTYREQRIRQAALDRAYATHPERFVNGPPKAPEVPSVVAINPEAAEAEAVQTIAPVAGVA